MDEKRSVSVVVVVVLLTTMIVIAAAVVLGYVLRFFGQDLISNAALDYRKLALGVEIILGAALLAALVMAIAVNHFVEKPINELHEMADDVINGDVARLARVSRSREFKDLAEKINMMVESVVHTQSEADVDRLTGVNNFRHLNNYLETQTNLAARYDRPLALALLDIDNFSEINDRYGHGIGDNVLKMTVAYLKSTLRQVDYVGRYGGETFIMILPETEAAPAMMVMEKIHREFTDHVFVEIDHEKSPVFASLGVADYPRSGEDAASLIASAKMALLLAKRRGRNQVTYFRALNQEAG